MIGIYLLGLLFVATTACALFVMSAVGPKRLFFGVRQRLGR